MSEQWREHMREHVRLALVELCAAGEELQTTVAALNVPHPRPRVFNICRSIRFPFAYKSRYREGEIRVEWTVLAAGERMVEDWRYDKNIELALSCSFAADQIVGICGWQPVPVLRAVRQIEAATRWCRARTRSLQRAARR